MAGQITEIRVQKRNPRRANVFVDDEFAFGLAMIEAAKLHKGQYLSDEDIAALQVADEQERAYERALHFLSYRPRSKAEVARRLRRDFSEAGVDAVVCRLSRVGLLDDEAFAEYWISNREQFKPRGRRALRYELRQKGVDHDIIDALLEQNNEVEGAYRVATGRLARWQHLDVTTLRRKLSEYLVRRGFSYQAIGEVWERIAAERENDESEGEEREGMQTCK